ncbi:MAG TPA: M35 family metallo-endopeptidase [Thermoanaerobaculia bacterium]|nr:M35 family metallo-endopeptidase [Thermoanaerobaculia bacterium]
MLVLSRLRPRAALSAVFAVLLGAACSSPVPAQAPALSARLEVANVEADHSQAQVRFTLENEGRSRVRFLKWGTPLEGFRSQVFEVTCSGRAAAYHGPTVKRGEPGPNDYLEIGGGQALSATLDLASVYDLPAGDCVVSYDGVILDVVSGETVLRAGRMSGSPVTLRVNPVTLPAQGSGGSKKLLGLTYTGCSVGQQAALATAVPAGGGLATAAQSYLDNVPVPSRPNDTRYRTWFGTYDATRYGTVSGRYGQIAAAAAGNLTLNCTGAGQCGGQPVTCDPGDFAFTCAGGASQTIWLCSGFFAAPATGYNSQAGTIVHELSHWYGTRDNAYGCRNCQSLASSDPVQAVANADNCEYMAENFGLVCP